MYTSICLSISDLSLSLTDLPVKLPVPWANCKNRKTWIYFLQKVKDKLLMHDIVWYKYKK